jgi:hypothetical protein
MPLVSVPKSKNIPNANRMANAENDADLYENNKSQPSNANNPQANKPKPKSSATRIASPSSIKQTSTPITQKKVMSEDSNKSFEQQKPSSKSKNENFRLFIALFDYDPFKMSPNTDSCQEELAFKEGQAIKIFGEQDADGFYYGETNGKFGYIPCNMISEVQVNDPDVVKQLLNDSNPKQTETQKQRSKNSSSSSFSQQNINNANTNLQSKSKTTKSSSSSSGSKNQAKEQSFVPINNYQYNNNSKSGSQSNQNTLTMIALYDYDPQSLSPNADADVYNFFFNLYSIEALSIFVI